MLNVTGVNKDEFLEYKGRPLVRQGDDIYYGDLSDKYHVYMMIMDDKDVKGVKVPTMVMVQLREKGSVIPKKQNLCTGGLIDALETAAAWLEIADKEN
jgi:hypothetical protein